MDAQTKATSVLRRVNALIEAMRFSVQSVPADSPLKYSSFKIYAQQLEDTVTASLELFEEPPSIRFFKSADLPDHVSLVWPRQKDYFDHTYANALLLKAALEDKVGFAQDELRKLTDFIAAHLRAVVFSVPDKETEIQNALETLLIGRGLTKGLDYDRETGRVKSSGRESVPDFIFPKYNLCAELKLVRSPDRLKSIVDEINADIRVYEKVYARQLYVIYDLGAIRNETEVKRDLISDNAVSVVVVKH